MPQTTRSMGSINFAHSEMMRYRVSRSNGKDSKASIAKTGVMMICSNRKTSERKTSISVQTAEAIHYLHLHQFFGHRRQISKHWRTLRQSPRRLGFDTLAGQHQIRLRSNRCGGLQVAQRIAHCRHARKTEVVTS